MSRYEFQGNKNAIVPFLVGNSYIKALERQINKIFLFSYNNYNIYWIIACIPVIATNIALHSEIRIKLKLLTERFSEIFERHKKYKKKSGHKKGLDKYQNIIILS